MIIPADFKQILPFLLVNAVFFYLLPALAKRENKLDTGFLIVLLLFLSPAVCFICSVVYGAFYSFNLFYPLFNALLFVPAVFIFYNSSALIYTIFYGIIALAGNALGMLFYSAKI